MLRIFIHVIAILILSSCTFNASIVDLNSNESAKSTDLEKSTFTSVVNPINSQNVTTYSISGSCGNLDKIQIYFDETLIASLSCTANAWSLPAMDFSSHSDGSHTFKFISSASGNTLETTTVLKDTLLPTAFTPTHSATHGLTTESPVISWTAASDNPQGSGIRGYEISIGTSSGLSDTFPWIEIGNLTNYSAMGLSLISSQTYFANIRAIDNAGNKSAVSSSTGWSVLTPAWTPMIFIGSPGLQAVTDSTVDLILLADSTEYTEMYITNTAGCGTGGSWESYSTSKSNWILDPSQQGGIATVYVKFRKASLVESACVSDTIDFQNIVTLTMCTDTSSTASNGIIYDSGGSNGEYSEDENCSISINTGQEIKLQIDNLDTEDGFDFLTAYNQTATPQNILFDVTGTTAPSDVHALSGTLILNFTSDSSMNQSGFIAKWFSPLIFINSSIKIDNGAIGTTSSSVTLNIDYKNLTQMYITNSSGCSSGGSWESVSATKSWILSAGADGTRSVYIKFRDPSGNETPCETDSILMYTAAPMAVLTGTPASINDLTAFDVVVGGNSIISYKYKWGLSGSTDCTSSSGYSSTTSVSSDISLDLSSESDGLFKLCVVGINPIGTQQSFSSATEFTWQKKTPAIFNFDAYEKILTEGNTSHVLNLSLSKPVATSITIDYFIEGTAVSPTHHNLASGSYTFSALQTSATIPFDIYDNALTDGSRSIVIHAFAASDSDEVVLGKKYFQKIYIIDDEVSGSFTSTSQLSLGNSTFCLIDSNQKLKCWGSNNFAQIGDGTTIQRATPVAVDSGTNYKKVTTGSGYHTCAITSSDDLKCWGLNTWGQIGDNSTFQRNTPVIVDGGTKYLDVSVGFTATCGVTLGNVLKCWGGGLSHQLGDGTTDSKQAPFIIDSGTSYLKVFKRGDNTCGITTSNKLKCWGENYAGVLGNGTTTAITTPTIIDGTNDYESISLSTGIFITCGLTTLNKIRCWGVGYLGDGSTTSSSIPVSVDPSVNYKSIQVNSNSACALTTGDQVKCWGYGYQGGLASEETNINAEVPTLIKSGESFTEIYTSASADRFCGKTADGIIKCWGSVSHLMPETPSTLLTPIVIGNFLNLKEISSDEKISCGITVSDELFCWGSDGALMGGTNFLSVYPIQIDKGVTYRTVKVRNHRACAITTSNVLKCWGSSSYGGYIGDGSSNSAKKPVIIDSGTSYSDVSLAPNHTCAITNTGVLKCWGNNDYYQLGNGNTTLSPSPIIADSGSSYQSIALGWNRTCGVTTANKIKCWGDNTNGYLGDAGVSDGTTPVEVDSTQSYKKIFSSDFSTCAITTADKLRCWGENSRTLGDGTTVTRTSPVDVDNSTSYKYVTLDMSIGCGITLSNDLKCWGYRPNGDGTFNHLLVPTLIDSGTSYLSVIRESYTYCGVTTGNSLKCWATPHESVGNGQATTQFFPKIFKELSFP